MTRLSRWLMKIAGKNNEVLVPRTDLEKGLAAIAENGGGGAMVVTATENGNALELTVSFADVLDALSENKMLFLEKKQNAVTYLVPLYYYRDDSAGNTFAVEFAFGSGDQNPETFSAQTDSEPLARPADM